MDNKNSEHSIPFRRIYAHHVRRLHALARDLRKHHYGICSSLADFSDKAPKYADLSRKFSQKRESLECIANEMIRQLAEDGRSISTATLAFYEEYLQMLKAEITPMLSMASLPHFVLHGKYQACEGYKRKFFLHYIKASKDWESSLVIFDALPHCGADRPELDVRFKHVVQTELELVQWRIHTASMALCKPDTDISANDLVTRHRELVSAIFRLFHDFGVMPTQVRDGGSGLEVCAPPRSTPLSEAVIGYCELTSRLSTSSSFIHNVFSESDCLKHRANSITLAADSMNEFVNASILSLAEDDVRLEGAPALEHQLWLDQQRFVPWLEVVEDNWLLTHSDFPADPDFKKKFRIGYAQCAIALLMRINALCLRGNLACCSADPATFQATIAALRARVQDLVDWAIDELAKPRVFSNDPEMLARRDALLTALHDYTHGVAGQLHYAAGALPIGEPSRSAAAAGDTESRGASTASAHAIADPLLKAPQEEDEKKRRPGQSIAIH